MHFFSREHVDGDAGPEMTHYSPFSDIIIAQPYFTCGQLCTAPLSVSIIIHQPSQKHSRHAYNTEGVESADVWNKGQLDSTWAVPYDPCRIVHIRRQWNSRWEENAIHHTVFSVTMGERQRVINHSRLVWPFHKDPSLSLSLHATAATSKSARTCFTCGGVSCQIT